MDLLLKYQIALKIYYKNNVKKLSNWKIFEIQVKFIKVKVNRLRRYEKKN